MPAWSSVIRRDSRILSSSVNVEWRTTSKPGCDAPVALIKGPDTITHVAVYWRQERNGHQQIQYNYRSRVLKTCTGVSGGPQNARTCGSFLP